MVGYNVTEEKDTFAKGLSRHLSSLGNRKGPSSADCCVFAAGRQEKEKTTVTKKQLCVNL